MVPPFWVLKLKTVRPFGNASPVIEEFATVNSNGGSVTIEGMGDGISLVRSSDWNGRVEHCAAQKVNVNVLALTTNCKDFLLLNIGKGGVAHGPVL